ncbi:hypothetical protein LJK87_07960 [Paenibacillus sp. P25]|nr:hypothetical protein LJK87_07960 [Paenibacillus sp. P25]
MVGATVTSRSVKDLVFASILSYDPNSKVLTVTSDNGDPSAFKFTDATAIKYNGASLPLSNFQSMFIDNGIASKSKRVNLKVSNKNIVQIEFATQISGTVAQVNTTGNQITIRSSSGQNLTFSTSSGIGVEMMDRTGATLADLKVGDSITATLNLSQDFVSAITLKKVGVYKTIVTNATTRQVSVRDENGTLLTFTVDTNDKIANPGKATHAFEDIQIDEYVKATFNGSKLDNMQLAEHPPRQSDSGGSDGWHPDGAGFPRGRSGAAGRPAVRHPAERHYIRCADGSQGERPGGSDKGCERQADHSGSERFQAGHLLVRHRAQPADAEADRERGQNDLQLLRQSLFA